MQEVKVTVLCLAYNHAKFIRRALDGFVMQKTDFPFEVLVHDDASTDGTADIVREYAERYPAIIKPILQTENQYSHGGAISRRFLWPRIRGEYVASCEGDDYWVDDRKLQKQADWLDAHPSSGLCFHYATVHWEDGSTPDALFPDERRFGKPPFTFQGLLRRNFIQSSSVMYRWRLKGKENEALFPGVKITPRDWLRHLYHAEGGEIGFIPEVMSVYRRHSGGVWWGSESRDDRFYLRNGLKHLAFFDAVRELFGYDDRERSADMAWHTLCAAIRANDFKVAADIAGRFPCAYADAIAKLDGFPEQIAEANRHAERSRRHAKRCLVAAAILAVLLAAAILSMLA